MNNKYSQKLLDSAKKSATDAIKTTSKRAIQKTAEATGDLIYNKIADKITSTKMLQINCVQKQMRMKQKYQKKDIYLQRKEYKLLMNWNQYKKIIMEYQKIIKWLGNTPNQLSKSRTKKWIEINDQPRGVYNTNRDIRFNTKMLKSSLCDYSDAHKPVKERITIIGAGDDAA